MALYILKMTNIKSPDETGMPNAFWLVGPFETEDALGAWGRNPANNPNDNPCWQSIDLDPCDLTMPVRVVAP